MPPGIKSRATVATIPTIKMARIIAKLATPQNETPVDSSSSVGVNWFFSGPSAHMRTRRDLAVTETLLLLDIQIPPGLEGDKVET